MGDGWGVEAGCEVGMGMAASVAATATSRFGGVLFGAQAVTIRAMSTSK